MDFRGFFRRGDGLESGRDQASNKQVSAHMEKQEAEKELAELKFRAKQLRRNTEEFIKNFHPNSPAIGPDLINEAHLMQADAEVIREKFDFRDGFWEPYANLVSSLPEASQLEQISKKFISQTTMSFNQAEQAILDKSRKDMLGVWPEYEASKRMVRELKLAFLNFLTLLSQIHG
ncbi:MAG: hypothetical protein P4L74_00850 [Candidatus Doudnabacteria bacterium]|nr:hypothetical protein [Candidatus Doudnabacteria bacterium]